MAQVKIVQEYSRIFSFEERHEIFIGELHGLFPENDLEVTEYKVVVSGKADGSGRATHEATLEVEPR